MPQLVFDLLRASGAVVVAPLLVSPLPFSARYDLDRVSGRISRIGHPLEGEAVGGHILLAPGVQGGVAAGWALPVMKDRGVGFAGLVFTSTNPAMVQGAVTANISIADGIAEEAFEHLASGMIAKLDPARKRLTVLDARRSRV